MNRIVVQTLPVFVAWSQFNFRFGDIFFPDKSANRKQKVRAKHIMDPLRMEVFIRRIRIKIHIDGKTGNHLDNFVLARFSWHSHTVLFLSHNAFFPHFIRSVALIKWNCTVYIEHVQKTFTLNLRYNIELEEKNSLVRVTKQSELMKCESYESRFVKVFLLNFVSSSGCINGIWLSCVCISISHQINVHGKRVCVREKEKECARSGKY